MSPQQTIAHYRITAKLGEGGMGEVYQATDTKLNRDVAIKILPDAFARDADRMARFAREAQVLASLNHPNIAAIYGVEERALVMELVEGPTLGERIASGAIPADEALPIAKQIAEALEYAHERSIIHRDLKPANIKITPEGRVKVLDFGLAKAMANEPAPADQDASPTLTIRATMAGVIMGTAAYMSPEQAAGKPVDKRADVWSFGVVLWELLTGRRLFDGETVSHTLADVLRAEIDFNKLPAGTPPPLRDLLRRCLDRDPRDRLRDIGEARVLITKTLANPNAATDVAPPAKPRAAIAPWVIAALFALVAGTLAFIHFRETPPGGQVLRYTVPLAENSSLNSFAISPDGHYLAMVSFLTGKRQLWLRALDTLELRVLPGTDNANYPFWSPDSRYIGFFANGSMKKIAATGGPAQSLCFVGAINPSGSWSRDDVILSSFSRQIRRVPAAGGTPVAVINTGNGRFPAFLPDGRHFLYLETQGPPEETGIYMSSLDSPEKKRVIPDISGFVFAPPRHGRTGHILFIRENSLMAVSFDAATGRTSGEVFPIAGGVSFTGTVNYAPVTVSESGLLVYAIGGLAGSNQIAWFDRTGRTLGSVGTPGPIFDPSLSPDERSIAFMRQDAGNSDLWLHDLARSVDVRFTSDPSSNLGPVWSPKGDRIVFRSNRGGHLGDLYQKAANGSGQDELLLSTPNFKTPSHWSRDGQFIVYSENDPKTHWDLWLLPVGAAASSDRKPVPFLQSQFNEYQGQISPDGHWIAYASDESGALEVYVRPFPAGDGKWRISISGGEQPRWRGDGKEIFFVGADGKITAAAIKAVAAPRPSFEPGTPVPLFDPHILGTPIYSAPQYDVTADGKRFLVNTARSAAAAPPLTVVLNWDATLR